MEKPSDSCTPVTTCDHPGDLKVFGPCEGCGIENFHIGPCLNIPPDNGSPIYQCDKSLSSEMKSKMVSVDNTLQEIGHRPFPGLDSLSLNPHQYPDNVEPTFPLDGKSIPISGIQPGPEPAQHVYHVPTSSADVFDPRLRYIKGAMWTTVVVDDALFSELISFYLRYEYPISLFFQKDLFLDRLLSGQTDHCSSLLVNAVLATAARAYNGGSFAAHDWDLDSLSSAFDAEAMALWELELSGEPSLTTIQAAQILSLRYMVDNMEPLGVSFLSQAVNMADNIGLFAHRDDPATDMGMARTFSAWSLFDWQSTCCFYKLQEPLVLDPPIALLPYYLHAQSLTGELVLWDETLQSNTSLHLGLTFRAISSLNVIINDINHAARKAENSVATTLFPQQALTFCARLKSWFNALPIEFQARSDYSMAHHLRIHIAYYHSMITLLEPWLKKGPPAQWEGRDIHTLYELGTNAQTNLQKFIGLYCSSQGPDAPDEVSVVHLLLLGFAPGREGVSRSAPIADYG